MLSSKILIWHKYLSYRWKVFVIIKKKLFKVGLQYLFNVVILSVIILKVDPKTYTFKNLEEISQKQVATLLI